MPPSGDATGATDTARINAALAAGGVVQLAKGIYFISSTLNIGGSVRLLGEVGAGYFFGGGTITDGTVLRWVGGASIVVKITPATTAIPVVSPGLENLSIDGQGVATFCLRVEATVQGSFKNVVLRGAVTAALYTGQTTLGGYTGLNYTYGCDFSGLYIDQDGVGFGDGIQLDGNATGSGDTTFCNFRTVLIHHRDGVALKLISADTNVFQDVDCSRNVAGTGIGVELKGNNTGGNPALGNTFLHCWPGTGGVTARGTPGPSKWNSFFGYSNVDTVPVATVEAGALVQFYTLTEQRSGAIVSVDDTRRDILMRGQGLKGENFSRYFAQGGTAVVTGTVYYLGVPLVKGDVVTNILVRILTLGAGITANKVGLYDSAGNLLATSADLGVSWQTTGFKTHALTGAFTVTATGLYYIALFCTFTVTAPQPMRCAALTGSFDAVGTGVLLMAAQTGVATNLPNPGTLANSNGFAIWAGWS